MADADLQLTFHKRAPMIFELTSVPTLVITGTWNVPIFTPPWVARHLFGYPVNAEAPLVQVTTVASETARTINYFQNQGFNADARRVELFANADSDASWTRLEDRAKKLLTTLPHTPIGSLGVNFRFVENNPGQDLLHKLTTEEDFAGNYQVLATQARTRIAVDASFVCQVQRDINDAGSMMFDFNYHFDKFGEVANRAEALTGIVKPRLAHAKELLDKIYGLNAFEVATHDFSAEMGPDWGEDQ